MQYLLSILALQSSPWGKDSWLIYFICVLAVLWPCCMVHFSRNAVGLLNGKLRLNSGIKPKSIKISSVTCGPSSVKIHYSVNRMNEAYVFFDKISPWRYFIEKT